MKLIDRACQAVAHCAAVALAEGKAENFESAAVMFLQQFCDQERHRMDAKVGRQIADANLVVRDGCTTHQRLRKFRYPVPNEGLRTFELKLGFASIAEQRERIDHRFGVDDM